MRLKRFIAVERWLADCQVLRGQGFGGMPFDHRHTARKAFFEIAARYPYVRSRDEFGENGAMSNNPSATRAGSFLEVDFGGVLPSEDDENALSFLCDCNYNAEKATILLAAIAGGGHEVSALRHIESARSHILGGKVRP